VFSLAPRPIWRLADDRLNCVERGKGRSWLSLSALVLERVIWCVLCSSTIVLEARGLEATDDQINDLGGRLVDVLVGLFARLKLKLAGRLPSDTPGREVALHVRRARTFEQAVEPIREHPALGSPLSKRFGHALGYPFDHVVLALRNECDDAFTAECAVRGHDRG
jgi:hypothetical protein